MCVRTLADISELECSGTQLEAVGRTGEEDFGGWSNSEGLIDTPRNVTGPEHEGQGHGTDLHVQPAKTVRVSSPTAVKTCLSPTGQLPRSEGIDRRLSVAAVGKLMSVSRSMGRLGTAPLRSDCLSPTEVRPTNTVRFLPGLTAEAVRKQKRISLYGEGFRRKPPVPKLARPTQPIESPVACDMGVQANFVGLAQSPKDLPFVSLIELKNRRMSYLAKGKGDLRRWGE